MYKHIMSKTMKVGIVVDAEHEAVRREPDGLRGTQDVRRRRARKKSTSMTRSVCPCAGKMGEEGQSPGA